MSNEPFQGIAYLLRKLRYAEKFYPSLRPKLLPVFLDHTLLTIDP